MLENLTINLQNNINHGTLLVEIQGTERLKKKLKKNIISS